VSTNASTSPAIRRRIGARSAVTLFAFAALAAVLPLAGLSDRALASGHGRGGETAGASFTGNPPVVVSVGALMSQQSQANATGGFGAGYTGGPLGGDSGTDAPPPAKRHGPHDHHIPGRDPQQDSSAPDTSSWPPSGPHAGAAAGQPTQNTPQSVGASFVGSTLAESGFIPPDSMAAVGPTQILVVSNGVVKVFSKTGVLGPLNVTSNTFFSSVAAGSDTSDPRVIYDRLSQRWFVVMINVSTPNLTLIAVSSGPTITGTSSFTFFSFQHDFGTGTGDPDHGGFCDYPSLGVDANALYIGGNIFDAAGSWVGTSAYVVQKAGLLLPPAQATCHVTAFRDIALGFGAGPSSPRGVSNDDPNATEGYFIGSDNQSFGLLTIRRVTNPGSLTPSISGNLFVSVPSTAYPNNVPALGDQNGSTLDALDDRLYSALLKNGSLWTAHSIGVDSTGVASATPDRDATRWYEIRNMTGTPTLYQSGTFYDSAASNPKYYWVGSVAVSGQGIMALGASYAGAANHAGIALSGRFPGDSLGTQAAPSFIASSTSYNVQTGTGVNQRWGDYSFTCVDPTDDMTMWTAQEICNATNSWGVEVVKLVAPPPATPASASPSSIAPGTTASVVLTGTSASGSGFFDPGAAFPNRIAAAVNGGGVTVNSITYSGPTSLTLNLTVASSAAAGARTITITNPDGQAATSATGILTIAQNKAATTTSIASSLNPSTYGQAVVFTATVTGANATGTVAFNDGSTAIGSPITLAGGVATLSTSALGAGAHSITAVYSGDGNFLGSTSSAVAQTVNQAGTTTTVTSGANPAVYGQAVVLTVNVAAAPPGAGTPGGGLATFFDGTTTLGTKTVSGGTASITVSSLSVGAHSITASYAGDASFTGSSSSGAPLNETVNPDGTTTTLSASVSPATYGQSVTIKAIVAAASPGAGAPTGSVTFTDGAAQVTAPVSGGQALYTTSSLAVGGHSITATFSSADGNFTGSASAQPLALTVSPAGTATTLSSSLNPSAIGQVVTFQATVTVTAPGSGAPTGNVTFLDASTTIGSGPVTNGQASFATSGLAIGTHSITARYETDGNYATSTSAAVSQVVTIVRATPITKIAPTGGASVYGQPVAFNVNVSGPGGTPTGSVTLSDSAASLGTLALDVNGNASFTISSLAVGPHTITASYGGDANFLPNTSDPLSQPVGQASVAITFSASPASSVFGQAVVLTAAVAVVAPGAGSPTGAVSFYDGGTLLGAPSLDGSGTATWTTSGLAVGPHSLSATYGGDTNFAGNSAGGLSQSVGQATTTTTVGSSPNPSAGGQTVVFSAIVSAVSPGAGKPTGSVQFFDGGSPLGTATLSGGTATLSTSTLALGAHSITATYGGDSSFGGSSTSAALTQNVTSGKITFSSGNVNVPIPDLGTGLSSITIPAGITIKDIDVNLNINHTYDSDMVMTLISPTGQTLTLVNRRGGSGQNFVNTTLDSEASTAIRNGRAPFTGSYRPEQSLTTFNGKPATGTWTLKVQDVAALDSGTILNWSLIITTQ
jgi:subtilisin-like proprotein convertase family protein